MSLVDFERSTHSPGHGAFHLERMAILLDRLGQPHLGTPTVHVAGTKGKGSTAAMVTSILTAEGYKVGLYTSPHLHRAVERIRVGLEQIDPDEFADLVSEIWPAVRWVGESGGYGAVTTFEMLTAMSFQHFRQVAADFQVVEVGLGGRLDATNVVSPEVCAITPISLDHTATLGDTVELIAYEKAGIIKQDVPVVIAPQSGDAIAVIRRVAQQKRAPVLEVASAMSWRGLHADLDGQSFEVLGSRGRYELWTSLLGAHQMENASAAVAVIETLVSRGFDISERSIVDGLGHVRWPARLQVLSREAPMIVVDGAHNPFSMGRLVEAVGKHFEYDRIIVLFGALGSKSAEGMLAELSELSPSVVAVSSRDPRSAPSDIISMVVSQQGLDVLFESEDVASATRRVIDMAGAGDLVLGTGSLFVAAEVIEVVQGIKPELYHSIKRPMRVPQSRVRT